jgi:hypothetical protein
MISICMTPAHDGAAVREALRHWRNFYRADPALLIVPRELVANLLQSHDVDLLEEHRTFKFQGIHIVTMADWWDAEAEHYGELDTEGRPGDRPEMLGSGATVRALRAARIHLEVEMQMVDYIGLTPEQRESVGFMARWFRDRRWWQQRQGSNS